jgi:tRNA1(Val) A37 N6-methylase TrmN6
MPGIWLETTAPTLVWSRQAGPMHAMSLDQTTDFVKHQSWTEDAFLGGRLTVSQPRAGFRAGLDSVLLGAAVGTGRKRLLDLGAGVGTAALVALAHDNGLTATLAEKDPDALALAERNIAANGFAGRATALAVDVAARGSIRQEAGLGENAYDSVIANPPFFGSGTQAPQPDRAGARHMEPEAIELWVKTAAGCAGKDGEAIFIYPAAGLAALLAAFEGRFGAIHVLPLTPREGQPATRVLVRGIKGSRAPLVLLASRAMHEAEGRAFAPQFEAIFRGEARLVW